MFKVGRRRDEVRIRGQGRKPRPHPKPENADDQASSTCSCDAVLRHRRQRSDAGGSPSNPEDQPFQQREFANSARLATGSWLHGCSSATSPVRVSLEATGIYSLDLGSCPRRCCRHPRVAVLNPKAVHRLRADPAAISRPTRRTRRRMLAEYQSRRMPFVAWRAPDRQALRLRTLSRHIEGLTVEQTRHSIPAAHAAQGSSSTPPAASRARKRSLAALQRRILRHAARSGRAGPRPTTACGGGSNC